MSQLMPIDLGAIEVLLGGPKDLPCLQDRYHVDNYRDFCKRCLDLCGIFTTDFGSERPQGPRDCY